jgi:hypothetical protein
MFFSLYRWMQGDNAMTIVGTDGLTIIVLALGAAMAIRCFMEGFGNGR